MHYTTICQLADFEAQHKLNGTIPEYIPHSAAKYEQRRLVLATSHKHSPRSQPSDVKVVSFWWVFTITGTNQL